MQARRNRLIIVGIVLVLVALAVWSRPNLPRFIPPASNAVKISDSYRLTGPVDDSLFVIARTLDLAPASHVAGDAALVGDRVTVDGTVDGDLTVTADTLALGGDSYVTGDLLFVGDYVLIAGRVDGEITVSGGELIIDPGARIAGMVNACVETVADNRASPGELVPCGYPGASKASQFLHYLGGRQFAPLADTNWTVVGLLSSLFVSVVLTGLAALAVAVFPRQISHIEEAIRTRPRGLVVHGLMIFLLIIGLGSGFVVLLAALPPLGVVLLPFLLLLGVVFLGVLLAGLITLTLVFGEWLLSRRAPNNWPPLVTAAVGAVTLSALLHLPVIIPNGVLLSLAVLALLSAVAVGAAISTRLGTRSVRRSYFVLG